MGLLHKAVSKSIPQLDCAGQAVRDRILQLTHKNGCTALNLLKGYASFQKGACLSLKEDRYVSYAAIGFGIEGINLPLECLRPQPEHGNARLLRRNYYQIESSELFSLKPADEFIWGFPLDEEEPYRMMLLIIGGSGFNPRLLVRLVADIRDVLVSPPRQAGSEVS